MNNMSHFGYEEIPTNQKTKRVGQVFQSVAKKYDLMNDLMSFGLHRLWKQLALSRSAIQSDHTVLDLACGSANLSLLLAKKIKAPGKIIACDINQAMLYEGRHNVLNQGITNVQFTQANAESLPFPNHYFHSVIIAFGLRNVTHQDKALKEMARVLKPGGRVVILEFSHVKNFFLKACYDLYSFSALPTLGKFVANDPESYRYLAESIRMHPDQETLKSMMETACFENVEYQNCHGGIVAIHTGFSGLNR